MESIDLCVPIYLNQQIIFDLLAILEDGFSQFSTIKTSTLESESKKADYGASIGISNVFALLGITLRGEKEKEVGTKEQKEVSKEKIYTPTSLFVKLRNILIKDNLINVICSNEDINKLSSGQFVEFRALLKKNPLTDAIETLKQIMEMALPFTEIEFTKQKGGQSHKEKQEKARNKIIINQINHLWSTITSSDSLELIGEILESSTLKAILSSKLDFFVNRDASEIIDGEFRVVGKVIRIIKSDSTETINLLRKMSFGRLGQQTLNKFIDPIKKMQDIDIKVPEIITDIKGPAIQIIPIAIFT